MTLTALVVDHARRSENSLRKLLQEYGVAKCFYASNKEEASPLALEADFILLCSNGSPQTEIDFTRWIRSEEALFNKPLILIASAEEKVKDLEIKAHGVDEILMEPLMSENVFPVLNQFLHANYHRTNLSYIFPFIESTEKIFSQMNISISHSSPLYILEDQKKTDAVTGIISFSGRHQGSLLISMNTDNAKKLVGKIFSLEEVEDEFLQDGVGELTNMIVGNAKKGLREQGISINLSIPNVVIGKSYSIARHHFQASVYSNLKSEIATIFLNVALIKEKKLS